MQVVCAEYIPVLSIFVKLRACGGCIPVLSIFVKLRARGGCGIRGCNMDVKKEFYDQKIRDVYRNVWFPERHVKNINLYIIT